MNGILPADFEGCIWDRSAAWDNTDVNPQTGKPISFYQASPATSYATANCSSYASISALSPNRNTVKSKIDAISANGATNTNIGMVWGKNVLNNTIPYEETDKNTKKIIIFLTDGLNVDGRIIQEGGTVSDMDNATLETCNDAKAAGNEIYSIRVMEGNEAMLRNCASGAGNYFNLTDPKDLESVFQIISDRIWNGMVALTR